MSEENKIRQKISDLTILISTAKEEGDEDKHKEVVDNIMGLFNQEKNRMISIVDNWFEIPENPENKRFRCDYSDILELKQELNKNQGDENEN